MAGNPALAQAVKTAIVAAAHLAAYERVAAAAEACRRLGALTSGRWRSVARDLAGFEDELQNAFATAAEDVSERATRLGIPEVALWTAGDAAAAFDLLRDVALDELEEGSPAARILQGDVVFGTSFVDDPDLPDRGTTLLFGWPEPLSPATLPWQATWVAAGGDAEAAQGAEEQEEEEEEPAAEELELYEVGDLEVDDALVAAIAAELGSSPDEARAALTACSLALTRASLRAADEDDADDEDADDEDQGLTNGTNGTAPGDH
jgi:hypothetical protein